MPRQVALVFVRMLTTALVELVELPYLDHALSAAPNSPAAAARIPHTIDVIALIRCVLEGRRGPVQGAGDVG